MPVPLDREHAIRVLIHKMALMGLGFEDIIVKLRQDGLEAPKKLIREIVMQARKP